MALLLTPGCRGAQAQDAAAPAACILRVEGRDHQVWLQSGSPVQSLPALLEVPCGEVTLNVQRGHCSGSASVTVTPDAIARLDLRAWRGEAGVLTVANLTPVETADFNGWPGLSSKEHPGHGTPPDRVEQGPVDLELTSWDLPCGEFSFRTTHRGDVLPLAYQSGVITSGETTAGDIIFRSGEQFTVVPFYDGVLQVEAREGQAVHAVDVSEGVPVSLPVEAWGIWNTCSSKRRHRGYALDEIAAGDRLGVFYRCGKYGHRLHVQPLPPETGLIAVGFQRETGDEDAPSNAYLRAATDKDRDARGVFVVGEDRWEEGWEIKRHADLDTLSGGLLFAAAVPVDAGQQTVRAEEDVCHSELSVQVPDAGLVVARLPDPRDSAGIVQVVPDPDAQQVWVTGRDTCKAWDRAALDRARASGEPLQVRMPCGAVAVGAAYAGSVWATRPACNDDTKARMYNWGGTTLPTPERVVLSDGYRRQLETDGTVQVTTRPMATVDLLPPQGLAAARLSIYGARRLAAGTTVVLPAGTWDVWAVDDTWDLDCKDSLTVAPGEHLRHVVCADWEPPIKAARPARSELFLDGPEVAARTQTVGRVRLAVDVSPIGEVVAIRADPPLHPELDALCLEAAAEVSWEPATQLGLGVATTDQRLWCRVGKSVGHVAVPGWSEKGRPRVFRDQELGPGPLCTVKVTSDHRGDRGKIANQSRIVAVEVIEAANPQAARACHDTLLGKTLYGSAQLDGHYPTWTVMLDEIP